MRSVFVRFGLFAAAIAVVVSCDGGLPTAPNAGTTNNQTGGSGGGSGTVTKDTIKPRAIIDTPSTGKAVTVGDSILVVAQLHDNVALKSVTFVGYTVKGSVNLGTYTQKARYGAITAPASGSFRPGLRDTVVRRYLQPLGPPIDTTSDSLVIRAYVTDSSGNTDSAAVRVNIANPARVSGKPSATLSTPLRGALVNIGDSILVTAALHDPVSLKNLTLVGYKVSGSVDLGTYKQTVRFATILVPPTGSFRPGLTDTTIRRYLQPVLPLDTTSDSLVIRAYVTDTLGLSDSSSVTVQLVNGPHLTVLKPQTGDSVAAGFGMLIRVHGTDQAGISKISIRIQGDSTWPTKVDDTISTVYNAPLQDVVDSTTFVIPKDAPPGSKVTVSAFAVDVNRSPGSTAPVVAFVKSASAQLPIVNQTVPPRMEIIDSILVDASGDGIVWLGYIARDSAGNVVKKDSVSFTQPYSSNVERNIPINLATSNQGMRLAITSFATDQSGRTGYSVPVGTKVGAASEAAAKSDSTLITYGRTYKIPHIGTIGDLAVDPLRGNVFLSNTAYNLLEVWQNPAKSFAGTGVAVGSQPWGLFVSNNPDTLLVANSGATTISQVYIGSSNPSADKEDLARRIRTRNTYVWQVVFAKDPAGRITLTVLPVISYSDRPQYVAESKGGRIYYSTRPTAAATPGTVRWLDPKLPVPDPRQIWRYGTVLTGDQTVFVLFNIDSVIKLPPRPGAAASDMIRIWDHQYGQLAGDMFEDDSVPSDAMNRLGARGSDEEWVINLDTKTLELTDTTFMAASGDRSWIAFGEGNTKGSPGRVAMINDPSGPLPAFFSPVVTTSDLIQNASEPVFGIAIDSTGLQLAAHGLQSYFSSVDNPFHLRLSGTYDSFDNGAGIAFHPQANGFLGANNTRVAFSASQSGQIEIIDVAYFINRGTLQLKNGLYGPLRASQPLPGDPPDVVLKLFGLSTTGGLVVIDLRASDIKPGP